MTEHSAAACTRLSDVLSRVLHGLQVGNSDVWHRQSARAIGLVRGSRTGQAWLAHNLCMHDSMQSTVLCHDPGRSRLAKPVDYVWSLPRRPVKLATSVSIFGKNSQQRLVIGLSWERKTIHVNQRLC